MMSRDKQPCGFTIFGVREDLSRHKLPPSRYQLGRAGLLHDDTGIVGVARRDPRQAAFAAKMRAKPETLVMNPLQAEAPGGRRPRWERSRP